jgi:hypothetical protein
MNAEIEYALKSYLTTQLAAVTGISIHAATSRDVQPKDRRTVMIAVRDCPRLPTQSELYNAVLTVVITTPVIKDATVAQHSALVKAARWALKPVEDDDHNAAAVTAAKAALDAAVQVQLPRLHGRSTWLEGPRELHTAEDWQTVNECTLLLTED